MDDHTIKVLINMQ